MVPASELPQVVEREAPEQKLDFRESMQWRIFRIMAEFVEGFEFCWGLHKSVTLFGSARISSTQIEYKKARRLAKMLAKEGFAVVTGGGPGIMEAANRGAAEAKGRSVGLNIQLKYEQRINDYVNRAMGFHYFFTRKVLLSYSARAYVFFPGGFGTMDELFEILTLIQTQKIPSHIPIICVGKKHWQPIIRWIEKSLCRQKKYIAQKDTKLYHVVNTAKEAFDIVMQAKPRDDVNY